MRGCNRMRKCLFFIIAACIICVLIVALVYTNRGPVELTTFESYFTSDGSFKIVSATDIIDSMNLDDSDAIFKAAVKNEKPNYVIAYYKVDSDDNSITAFNKLRTAITSKCGTTVDDKYSGDDSSRSYSVESGTNYFYLCLRENVIIYATCALEDKNSVRKDLRSLGY